MADNPNPFDADVIAKGATTGNAFDQIEGIGPSAQTVAMKAPKGPPGPAPQSSTGLGFYQGLTDVADRAAKALRTGADYIGIAKPIDELGAALGLPSLQEATTGHQQYIADQAKQGYVPGAIGRLAGQVAGTVPLAFENPWLAGAATSGLMSDAQNPFDLARDMAIGAVGGRVGQAALGGVGNVIAGKVSPYVQKLMNEGVELTPGMISGWGKPIEDKLASVPFAGDVIRSAQNRAFNTFNRAAVNRALKPIGQSLPDDVATGYDAITHAVGAVNDAYDNVLPQLVLNRSPAFDKTMGDLRNLAQNLPGGIREKFVDKLDNMMTGTGITGSMTGPTMQDFYSDLGRFTRSYSTSADGAQRAIGQEFGNIKNQLDQLVEHDNPALAPAWRNANTAYANLLRVQKAAAPAEEGIFSPTQLQRATGAFDKATRGGGTVKSASSQGNALMQDLAVAGRAVIPSKIADSGTAGRYAMMSALGLLGGGAAAEHYGILPPQAGYAIPAAALLAGMYTRPGQTALRLAMTARPAAARAAGALINRAAPLGSLGGGAVSSDIFNSLFNNPPQQPQQ